MQSAEELALPLTWNNLSTNTAGEDGHWTFTDTSASNTAQRYFRAVNP